MASLLNCSIGDHEWFNINSLIFDVKHFVSASSIPHGRATALKRDDLWNLVWADSGDQPRADVLVRSHVHYLEYGPKVSGTDQGLCIITPAMQAMGTKFGSKKCSGIVHQGFISFDIIDKEHWSWKRHLVKLRSQKTSASIL